MEMKEKDEICKKKRRSATVVRASLIFLVKCNERNFESSKTNEPGTRAYSNLSYYPYISAPFEATPRLTRAQENSAASSRLSLPVVHLYFQLLASSCSRCARSILLPP
jgi:hypothetical protein